MLLQHNIFGTSMVEIHNTQKLSQWFRCFIYLYALPYICNMVKTLPYHIYKVVRVHLILWYKVNLEMNTQLCWKPMKIMQNRCHMFIFSKACYYTSCIVFNSLQDEQWSWTESRWRILAMFFLDNECTLWQIQTTTSG